MTTLGVYQILFFFLVILAITKPMGAFMARVFEGERTFLHPVLGPLERAIYRLGGIRETVEQRWTQYAGALLAFSVAKVVFTYAIQRWQGYLPLNPQGFGQKDVVFACHDYTNLPRTGRARSVLNEDSRKMTTGNSGLRLRSIGVIFGRENTAMIRSSILEHLHVF